jgi:acetylornithine deacetylase
MDPVLSLLRELVAIDSVNPSLVPGACGEGKIAAVIAGHMDAFGLDVQVEDVAPGRPNVVGVLEGRAPGRSLMFCGHSDTVGVEGMESPFEAREAGGRLYGRGAQDMKGGLAAMLDAARLVANRGLRAGRLVVAVVADEEYASLGADALVSKWYADAAIVTEPTDLKIGIAHKGFAWLTIETHGRAAHGSRPAEGRDAILAMGRVLGQLEALNRELESRPPHPLLGIASLHASIIAGGRELSSYPDLCRLDLERRTLPGESPLAARQEVREILKRLRVEDDTFVATEEGGLQRPPYEMDQDHPLPGALSTTAATHGLRAERVGMSFWTDAAVLGAAGIPALLFGPGGAGLHSTDEYVSMADVLACRDVLADLATTWCASPPVGSV